MQVFHALDYHAGLVPVYLEAQGGPLVPVALTLHNALYQGSLLQTLDERTWQKIERILHLPNVRRYTEFEGDFNMLFAVVEYMRRYQNGEGIRAVSHEYAKGLGIEVALLKGSPVVGHPNPMLEHSRPVLPEGVDLLEHKAACKAKVQAQLGLTVDPDAVLFSFVGRWTYEKGIDLIADIVPELLDRHPSFQIYICGPVGDSVGHYAATKLNSLAGLAPFKSRLFVKTQFFPISEEMRYGADFTICPSVPHPAALEHTQPKKLATQYW